MNRHHTQARIAIASRPRAAWLPAALLVAALVFSLAGVRLVPTANSAATDGTVPITASAGSVLVMNPSCGSVTIADLTPGDAVTRESALCAFGFGTNEPTGAEVTVEDINDLGAGSMRCISAGCVGNNLPELGGHPADPSVTSPLSFFGIRMASTASNGPNNPPLVDVWNVNGGAAGTGDYYDVPDAPDRACNTTGVGVEAVCRFRFAARAAGDQPSGTYEADVRFEVQTI